MNEFTLPNARIGALKDAGDILNEVCQILAACGCIMAQTPQGFALARKRNDGKHEAIAIIGEISPRRIEYKPAGERLHWTWEK